MTEKKIKQFLKEITDAKIPFVFCCINESNNILAHESENPCSSLQLLGLLKMESDAISDFVRENT